MAAPSARISSTQISCRRASCSSSVHTMVPALVDRDFNKVTEGYPADSVSQAGGMFCIAKGDEQTFLYMGLQETPEGD